MVLAALCIVHDAWAQTRGRIFEGIFYWFLVIKTLKTILSKLLQFFRFSSRGEDMLLRRR